MAAIWLTLTFCMMVAAFGARSWRWFFACLALAFLFATLFRESSPFVQEWFGS